MSALTASIRDWRRRRFEGERARANRAARQRWQDFTTASIDPLQAKMWHAQRLARDLRRTENSERAADEADRRQDVASRPERAPAVEGNKTVDGHQHISNTDNRDHSGS